MNLFIIRTPFAARFLALATVLAMVFSTLPVSVFSASAQEDVAPPVTNPLANTQENIAVGAEVPPDAALPECTLVLESDSSDYVVEHNDSAKTLSVVNPGWVQTISSSIASWIWGDDPVIDSTVLETQTFKKSFNWTANSLTSATLEIASDNGHQITLGSYTGGDNSEFNYGATKSYDVSSGVVSGLNTLQIAVTNLPVPNSTPDENPAGLIYKLTLKGTGETCGRVIPVVPTVPQDNSKTIKICKFNTETEDPISGWKMYLTNNQEGTDNVMYVLETGEDGCVSQSVNPDKGPFTATESEDDNWTQTSVGVNGGVILSNENDIQSCGFFAKTNVVLKQDFEEVYSCDFHNTLKKAEPETPVVVNTCLLPDSLNDDSEFTLNDSGEKTVSEMLSENGYSAVDTNADQVNFQVWNLVDPTMDSVTFSMRVLGKRASNAQIVGYYKAADVLTFTPVLTQVADTDGESSVSVTVPAAFANSFGFALQSDDKTWFSEKSLNTDSSDHVAVYNPLSNTYLLAFEDFNNLGDGDYNDIVVEISDVTCNKKTGGGGNDGGDDEVIVKKSSGGSRGGRTLLSNTPTGEVLGASTQTPTGEVLGESTSTLPVGAPNTGAGGASPLNVSTPTQVAVLNTETRKRK